MERRASKPKKPEKRGGKRPSSGARAKALVPAEKAQPAPALRRVPSQARSKERFGRILDAAEHEFAAQGYEAATTEAIAMRADASIGSLYQFFPNKRVLFDAVAERYLANVETFFTELLMQGIAELSWPDLIDKTIDAFWLFAHESKAFSAIWLNGHFSHELLHASDALNQAMEKRAVAVLEMYAPHLSLAKREVVATMVIEVTGLVLFIAARKKEPMATAFIEESKLLMRSYVTQYVAQAGAPVAKTKKPSRH